MGGGVKRNKLLALFGKARRRHIRHFKSLLSLSVSGDQLVVECAKKMSSQNSRGETGQIMSSVAEGATQITGLDKL